MPSRQAARAAPTQVVPSLSPLNIPNTPTLRQTHALVVYRDMSRLTCAAREYIDVYMYPVRGTFVRALIDLGSAAPWLLPPENRARRVHPSDSMAA